MYVNDPIADLLTRVRNAILAKHDVVEIPASKEKIEIARILKEEGFIRDYLVSGEGIKKINHNRVEIWTKQRTSN